MSLSGGEVFEIMARTHAGMLRTFILSAVRRPEDADDLFQETLVAAWRSLDRYDRSKPFAPWLRGIAMNLVSDWWRSEKRRGLVLCDEPTLSLLEERFSRLDRGDYDTWKERTAALNACLAELGGEDRHVIDLRYREGASCESIAADLARGVEWVKKRLQRARSELSMCVDGRLSAGEEVR